MRKFILAVTLCFAFTVIAHAGGCSELCNECERTGLSSVCCSAYIACGGHCKDAKKEDCPQVNWNTEDDNRRRQPIFAPAFEQERQVRRDVQEGVDRAIWNYQQNFQNPQQPRVGFGI